MSGFTTLIAASLVALITSGCSTTSGKRYVQASAGTGEIANAIPSYQAEIEYGTPLNDDINLVLNYSHSKAEGDDATVGLAYYVGSLYGYAGTSLTGYKLKTGFESYLTESNNVTGFASASFENAYRGRDSTTTLEGGLSYLSWRLSYSTHDTGPKDIHINDHINLGYRWSF